MSEPVQLLKSLTVDRCELLAEVGDCVILDTAGFQERLIVKAISTSQEDLDKVVVRCEPLEPSR